MLTLLRTGTNACRALTPSWRIVAVGAGVFLLIILWLGATEAGAVEITVSWTEVQREIRPRIGTWRSTKSVRLSLHGDDTISDSTLSMNERGLTSSRTAEGRLGEEIEDTGSSWEVKDSKTLLRTNVRRQHIQTIRVTTLSDTTCRAEVKFTLKAGFVEFQLVRTSNGEFMYVRSISAEKVSCRVTD
jgi:hypothetical protein